MSSSKRAPSQDTTAPFNLTGAWEGHYTQHDHQCPITALLSQEGNRITGTMTDGQTETERSLFDATAEPGLPPGAGETIDEQIRQMIPGAGTEPIRAESILPSQSQLDGNVDGRFVRFTKVYQGEHFVGFRIGDHGIGHVIERHTVQYSGRLSDDTATIEGSWLIHQPEAPRGFVDGMFVLRKV